MEDHKSKGFYAIIKKSNYILMKKIIKYCAVLLIIMTFSCNEEKFLEEKPLDFFTPSNALENASEFQAAVNYLHRQMRWMLWGGMNLDANFALRYATDFAVNATDYNPPVKLNDYKNTMVPTFSVARIIWESAYGIIFNSNVIIDNAPRSVSMSDNEKALFIAQAKFFRAWCYRMLGNLYGGVPLIVEEITSPRRDFVRATREEVYTQCKQDLLDAIAIIGNIDNVADGKVNKQVCQHLLAEIYISLGDHANAITMATNVINYSGVDLMRTRFGNRASSPGDVYSDLFQLNNQNRSSGNKEGLFVIQDDYRNAASSQRDALQWALMPNMESLTIIETSSGKSQPAIAGYSSQISGNGVGWIRPTTYFFYTIWKDDFNDMRNSRYSILRDFRIYGVDKTSPDYGKWYVADGYKAKVTNFGDTIRNFFPILKKATLEDGDFPTDFYRKDEDGNPIPGPFGGNILLNHDLHKDQYLHRLAETYLLRAEAYLMAGNTQAAANDINALRDRANTFRISASDVDIHLILDERLRELSCEELRMLTLTRLGLLYDRNVKYNEKSGLTIEPFHNLWPIPYDEIERNIGAVLEQNPGYN